MMNKGPEILLNSQDGACTGQVPLSLKKHAWAISDVCLGLEDPRVDVLYQYVHLKDHSLALINLYVRERVQVTIKENMARTFFATNNGPDVRCAFGEMQCQQFKSNFYNVFHLPAFFVTLYPNATKEHYELFLIEMEDVRPLSGITKHREDLFSSFFG